MYHRIADESFDPWGLSVHPARFQEQLDWLARNRTVLPVAEFSRMHREGRLPQDATAITFDDGYACTAVVAAPLLERMGLSATVFLPVDLIKCGGEFWWDDLERIVRSSVVTRLTAGENEIALGSSQDGDGRWSSYAEPGTPRQKAYRQLWAWLGPMPRRKRDAVLADLREQAGITPTPRESHRPMTASEIRSLDPGTIEFGSHGSTHADLLTVDDEEKAKEIGASFVSGTELTGRRPGVFPYPHGRFEGECERLVELAGFELACGTEHAFVSTRSRRFALPRLAVTNDGIDGVLCLGQRR